MQILIQQPTVKPRVTSVKFESKKKVIGNGTVENGTRIFIVERIEFSMRGFFSGDAKKGEIFR